jgi:hypothetical protein
MKHGVTLLVAALALAAARDAIKPFFEAGSIAEYNRWLAEHRDAYPDLRPVGTHPGLFTDSGAVLPSKVLEYQRESEHFVAPQTPYVRFVSDTDHCVVHYGYGPDAATAAYDRHGRKLFERPGYVQHRFNMWFAATRGSVASKRVLHPELPAEPESTGVLGDNGEVIGVLPGAVVWLATSSGDTLVAAASDGGALVFDREARIRWQDSVLGGATGLVAISPDAHKVAAVARDSLVVHDMTNGADRVLRIPSATLAGRRTNLLVWSRDSRRFALYRADSYGPGAAMLWSFTSDGKAATKPRRLDANYGEQLFWMGDTVVLATTPYVDSVEERLRGKHSFAGQVRITAVPLRGRVQKWMVDGRFREGSQWSAQGRCLACVADYYAAVFEVPTK